MFYHCVLPMVWKHFRKLKFRKSELVARSVFPSQNVKHTTGPDHFWRFRCGFVWQARLIRIFFSTFDVVWSFHDFCPVVANFRATSQLPAASNLLPTLSKDLHLCAHLLDSPQLSFRPSLLLSTPFNSCWLTFPPFHLSNFFSESKWHSCKLSCSA